LSPSIWWDHRFENFNFMPSQITLANAYKAHLNYKAELIAAANECNLQDLAPFLRDDRCALGKWLYGKGKLQYGATPEFDRLVRAHQIFYCVLVVIAKQPTLVTAGGFHRALIESAQLNAASIDIGVAVNHLRSAVA
jgi:aerotaxis receptor